MTVNELLKDIIDGLDSNSVSSGGTVAFIYDKEKNEIFDITHVGFSAVGLELEMEKK